jgi:hypothetical protein
MRAVMRKTGLLRLLLEGIRGMFERALLALCRTREIDGIRVHLDESNDALDEAAFEKVARVVHLVSSTWPIWLSRIRRDSRGILIKPVVPTQYWPGSKVCVLNRGEVLGLSEAAVGSALIHEATAAHLHRRWRRPSARWSSRIEAVCVRKQIAFLDRLPRDEWPSVDDTISYLRDRLYRSTGETLRRLVSHASGSDARS